MSFDPHEYLRHIVAEADYLRQQTAQVSKEEFLKSETLRRAREHGATERVVPGEAIIRRRVPHGRVALVHGPT